MPTIEFENKVPPANYDHTLPALYKDIRSPLVMLFYEERAGMTIVPNSFYRPYQISTGLIECFNTREWTRITTPATVTMKFNKE